MQGTGTQTDPYIPGNWEEFVEAVWIEGKYVSLPEGGGQFNMNEIDPVGGSTVNVRCKQIDGNGWIIHAPHNIRFYSSYTSTVINDLHFAEILYTNNNAVFRIYVAQVEIPAAQYTEDAENREQLPIDMGDVTLTLWSID